MSRRSVLTGVAAATIAATGAATNLAAQRPSNFSGHWVSYDSINGQPQDSFTLEYADRRLRIIGDSAAMAFEVDHVDADAKRVQAHGPVALTMSVNGVVYTLDLVHDTTTELRAKWASGGLTVTTGKGPWGLRQYGTVTVWLGDNGDLYLMTEIPSGDQPAKPKVVRYHRG
jgi:hypothetical protein